MSESEIARLKTENSILKGMVKRLKPNVDITDLLDNIVHCDELTSKLGWKVGNDDEVDGVLDQGDIQRICGSASREIKNLRIQLNNELYNYRLISTTGFFIVLLVVAVLVARYYNLCGGT